MLKYGLGIILSLLLILSIIYYFDVSLSHPVLPKNELPVPTVTFADKDYYRSGKNWLRKNDQGVWEMYLEGGGYERGLVFGEMARQLNKEKEIAFINEIKNRVPSSGYLNFLKYMVGWFNRDLDDYVPEEYLQEIFGTSRSLPDTFDFIAPKYHRALNYHAAHDIGHALQNMNLVGCTSFATWGERSERGQLLIGRNFDFYFGQEFAKDKIVAFYNPDNGNKFMSVTWACFSGVVSGMNDKGLSITLNSAKSDIPTKGRTPVSFIARDILQFASNIDEAYKIAASYPSFVSETFLIGSKQDGKVALIEKSQEKTAIYTSDTKQMVITNHFQSQSLKNDPQNLEYMDEGVSQYRYARVSQVIDSLAPMNATKVAGLLRDRMGLDGSDIGLGNEKAVNQLIAHHSVMFAPLQGRVWVSSAPYSLGSYLAYDLEEVFAKASKAEDNLFTYSDSLSIGTDPFLKEKGYQDYVYFLNCKEEIQKYLFTGKEAMPVTKKKMDRFTASNPNSYLPYYYLGDYLMAKEKWGEAKHYYEVALTKEIARTSEKQHLEEGLAECIKNMDLR